MIKQDNG